MDTEYRMKDRTLTGTNRITPIDRIVCVKC